jgi:glucose-6-phosphate dehydrogenase assembly protein OpcA
MEPQANMLTKGVDAARLERQLSEMWAEAARGEDGESALVRACVLNLVVYAESEAERREVDALVEQVIERHPCRAIVIAADRGADTARLDAYVSTRCQLSKRGARQICGEQITIEAAGPVVETASTAVAPLLVPDVPVFLWWKDIPHTQNRLFDRLSRMADRVVIDSATFDRPHEDLLRLAHLLAERNSQLCLSDLNWGRLTSWRALVASFWDVAAYRPALDRLTGVRVEYDPPDLAHEEIAPKALLALGWFAACLGWEPVSGGAAGEAVGDGYRFTLRSDGREIEAVLQPTDDAAGRDGMITSLLLTSSEGDEFRVGLRPEEAKLETSAAVGGERTVGRVLGYEARTEGQRLSAELDLLSRDLVFERSVQLAARLVERIS